MPFLEIDNVTLTFRGIAALTGVSFTVDKGGIVSLIGPNGAGKTSMLNCISGRYTPDSGSISLGGRDLLKASYDDLRAVRVRRGGGEVGV